MQEFRQPAIHEAQPVAEVDCRPVGGCRNDDAAHGKKAGDWRLEAGGREEQLDSGLDPRGAVAVLGQAAGRGQRLAATGDQQLPRRREQGHKLLALERRAVAGGPILRPLRAGELFDRGFVGGGGDCALRRADPAVPDFGRVFVAEGQLEP